MSILNMNQIEKSYGVHEVLRGFSLFLNEGERVGLIGPNGCGKTTALEVIVGMEPYSGGRISVKRGAAIGYLRQMPEFNPENTLYQELKTVFSGLIEMEEKLRELEKKISQLGKEIQGEEEAGEGNTRKAEAGEGNTGEEKAAEGKKGERKAGEGEPLEQLMAEYSGLQHRFEVEGGYLFESKIRQIASGMGFSLEELEEKKVWNLSGGEKTRLGLVKLLLTGPDLLLLDEPTNHLDLSSIQWLEGYLKEYQGTVVVVSHDRYFLDQVVTRVVEIKNGQSEVYYGNYSYYLEERKVRYEQLLRSYENQQKKIQKMEEAIKRLHQWGQQGDNVKFFRRARSMQKALDRIERLERPVLDEKQMGLELDISRRSGTEVLTIRGLFKSFAGPLLQDLDLNIYWGEKIAVIGKNGSGKTTLIKTIIDELEPDRGEVRVGANVTIGYYSQEFEGFNPEDDLITALRRESSMNTAETRNALAAFLFTEDDVFKEVGSLSGGEKSRLRLLQLMNGDYNFLILDEPTNHLDLPSREVLEEALKEYPGTVLVISHDRYFLNKIIDYLYELEDGSLTRYYGNYDYYRQKKEEGQQEGADGSREEGEGDSGRSDYHRLKEQQREERKRENRLKELEELIGEMEELLRELEEEMVKPENLNDFSLLNKLKERYDGKQKKLSHLYQEWEELLGEE